MSEGYKNDPPDAQGYILLHVFVGPVIATLSILVWTLISTPPHVQSPFQLNPMLLSEASSVLIGMFMAAWFFGLVPAILHAASMLIQHRLMGRTILWLLLTPLIGWFATWLPLLLIGGADLRAFTDGALMALIGSVAALECLVIAWVRRIYPVRLRNEFSKFPPQDD